MKITKDSDILDTIENSLTVHGREVVPGFRRKPVRWTEEEIELILEAVSRCGRKWHTIKETYNFPNRTWFDIAFKYRSITTKDKKPPKKEYIIDPWSSEETLTLIRGIEKFGCYWTKIRDWGFPEHRSRSSLQRRAKWVVERFRPANHKLKVYIDLHPNRVIVFHASYPHICFLKLKQHFPKEYRYYVYDYKSQNVHIYGKQGKLYVRPSKGYEFTHVQKLLREHKIEIPKKKTTKKTWYNKVLYWVEFVS